VLNGSDHYIYVKVNGEEHKLSTNMQPLIIPELKTNIMINNKTIVHDDFTEIVYCEQLDNGIKISGTPFTIGERVLGKKLYVTKNCYYSSDEGLLNKYFFNKNKTMLTVVSEVPSNIRIGSIPAALTVLKCGDHMLVESRQSELYIVNGGKELAVNLSEILSNYSFHKIIICSDASKTTFKRCDGVYDTQDLSVMYITLAGRIYYGGKCVYCPYSMYVILSIIFLFVIVACLVFAGVFLHIYS